MPPKPARVEIQTQRPACTVEVDAELAGKTDAEGALVLADIEPGDHYIHVQCPAEDAQSYFIAPRPGETVQIQHLPASSAPPGPETTSLEPAGVRLRLRQHIREAIQLRARGRIEEAIEHLRGALQLDPENSDLHREIGITFLVGKEWKRARIEMLEAIRHEPNDAEAYNGLGYALEKLNDLKGALEAYRVAARLEPGDASYRRRYLALLARIGPERKEEKK
jgi:tetratricopeptide (TPR) repeat protein